MEEKSKFSSQNTASGAVVIFFIFLFIFAKWGPSIPFSVVSENRGTPVMVTGQGKSTVIPDIAKISVGIDGQGQNLKQVQDSVNKKSQNLVSTFKNLGIEERDIKTTSYNIYPQSDYQVNPPKVTGYSVSINYTVTVRDIDKINDVLVAVTPAGANLVGGVSFDLSDEARAKAVDAARVDAVAKAKQNAESLARASGVSLGKIINVTESQNSEPRQFLMAADKAVGMGSAPAPDVQPGTTEVDLTVTLSYEVR